MPTKNDETFASLVSIQIALGDVTEIKDAVGIGYEADPGEERVMAASHPNAAISDTFGEASDGVTPTSAFYPAASRTKALANEAKSASGTSRQPTHQRLRITSTVNLRNHSEASFAYLSTQLYICGHHLIVIGDT